MPLFSLALLRPAALSCRCPKVPDIKPVLVRGDGHVLEWMLGVGKRSTLIYSELLGDPETGGNVLKGDIDFMEMLHSPFSIQKGCLVRFFW